MPGDFVDELLWRNAALRGGLRDLLPVLVEARQELDVVAAHAAISRDGVGADLLERVADVRIAIRVVDGGREIRLAHQASPGGVPSEGPPDGCAAATPTRRRGVARRGGRAGAGDA